MEALALNLKDLGWAIGLAIAVWRFDASRKKNIQDNEKWKTETSMKLEALTDRVSNDENRLNKHSERDSEIIESLHKLENGQTKLEGKVDEINNRLDRSNINGKH